MGPVGISKGWQEVVTTIQTHTPSVAIFLDVQTPRHRLRQLNKWTARDLSDYTMYAELGMGPSPTGVIMFVRSDLTPRLRPLEVDSSFEKADTGRILALQLQGVGAERPIAFVAVYMPVNVNKNAEDTHQCLRALTELRNRCANAHVPIVMCGDWNATARSGQRWGYSGDGWKTGDVEYRRFVAAGNWTTLEANKGREATWHSKNGQQSAVLDRALIYPPFLRTSPMQAVRSQDSCYDHHLLTFEIDGRDGGFDADLSEYVQEQLRLDMDQWDDKFLVVHRNWVPPGNTTSKWGRLRQALAEYVEATGEVIGWISNLKEKKAPFKLKGQVQ